MSFVSISFDDPEEPPESKTYLIRPPESPPTTIVRNNRPSPHRRHSSSQVGVSTPIIENIPQTIPNTPSDIVKCVYSFKRNTSVSWKGKRTHFQLSFEEIPLFHSKLKKSSLIDIAYISSGSESHYSDDNFSGYILVSNDDSLFSLRKGSKHAKDSMTIRISSDSYKKSPRTMVANLLEPIRGLPILLKSKNPKISNGNRWVITGHDMLCIISSKNTILVDKNGNPWIIVMKTMKDTLMITTDKNFDPLYIFLVGFASYICRK